MTELAVVEQPQARPANFETDPFELRVGASAFRGWTSIQHHESIEEAVSTLSVTLVGVYQDRTDEQIVAGDEVEAWVGGDQIFSGFAEVFSDGVTATDESLSISCRSRTCDLVDCSAPVKAWTNIRLDRLADELCDGFATSVVFEDSAAAAKVLRRFRTEPGEAVFSALDRVAKEQGLLVTCDRTGRLVLTRAGSEVSTTRIVRGRNVLATSGEWDMSGRFSSYSVKGQTFTDDEVTASATGDAADLGIGRYRPLIIVPDKGVDRAGALLRARWEAVTRAGKSLSASYTLEGWRQENGALWRPNILVRVTDRRKRLLDATLLVRAVDRTLDAGGRKTMLHLAPAAGFAPYVVGATSILTDGGRWFGAVEGTTRPSDAEVRRAEGR